eukprot:1181247-Prorocentrum_minimum.AAC.4
MQPWLGGCDLRLAKPPSDARNHRLNSKTTLDRRCKCNPGWAGVTCALRCEHGHYHSGDDRDEATGVWTKMFFLGSKVGSFM